jgi:hypothetical protein
LIVNVKKLGIEAAMVGALVFAAVGVGAGVANADQPVPDSPGVAWKLDHKPHWNDWDGEGGEGRDWDGPRYWNGPNYGYGGNCVWVPPAVAAWVPPAVC